MRKWIDTPDVKRNEQFITDWHYFLNDLQELVKQGLEQEDIKRINLYVLKTFFMLPYKTEDDFYRQFSSRLAEAKRQIFDGE